MLFMSTHATITLIQSLCCKMHHGWQWQHITCIMLTVQTADVNGDRRSDIVCTAEGGIMVWESKDVDDNEDIYGPSNKWTDLNFGFCAQNDKEVIF